MRLPPRSSPWWPWIIVAVHACLIPIAIFATLYKFGFENGLTPWNQRTWTPIISAQTTLLAMYLGLGSGTLARRLLWFSLGLFSVLLSHTWAYSMLCTFPAPKWQQFAYSMRFNSFAILLSPYLAATALVLVRPFIGGLQRIDERSLSPNTGLATRPNSHSKSTRQLSLKDIFLLTTFVAVGTGWISYLVHIELQGTGAKHIYDVIPIVPQLYGAAGVALSSLAITCLFFSRRFAWLGIVALLGYAASNILAWVDYAQRYPTIPFEWPKLALNYTYSWVIILATAVAYRAIGYRMSFDRTETRQSSSPRLEPLMRFSMRWMLAAMAYIALVATAISTRHPILTDLVWVVALLAFCFALVVAAVDRGRRRAMALGFVALTAVQIACINIAPTKGPTSWLYRMAGYMVRDEVIYERPAPLGGANARPGQGWIRASSDVPSASLTNGVMALLAGFLGGWIGLIAWKQQDTTNQATTRHDDE